MQRTLGHCDSRRNPDDLRFSKGTISLNFPIGQLHCENIYDVLFALEVGKLIPRDVPSLRVVSHGGQLWTLDNKLLYICRISPKVKRVSVVQVPAHRFLEKFLKENTKAAIERMSSAEFFPKVDNCDKSPRMELTFRADRVQVCTVKKILEKEKFRGKRSSARKSSSSGRSVSSSTTVTSRISSENAESGTPFPIGSTFLQSLDSMTSSIRRDGSSTESSGLSSEDTRETKTECYPAVLSMTGHHHPEFEDPVQISEAQGEHENASTRGRGHIFPSSFSERRPSTCQTSPRFSRILQRFPSAPRASRLVNWNSSNALTRLEPRISRTAQSYSQATDRPSSAAFPVNDSREHTSHNLFSTCRDKYRENVSQSVSATFPEETVHHFLLDNTSLRANVFQSFSGKFFSNSGEEEVSQGLSLSTLEIGRNVEPDEDFELEAFVLPEFCSAPPMIGDRKHDDEEEISPFHTLPRPHLDRSVSSCSSSTERPMSNKAQHSAGFPNKGEPRRKGNNENSSSLLRTFSLLQKSNIGRSLSPLRRASISAGRSMKCHLSAENEFQVSKQLLLKHLKKAFFAVC
ncbi:unnamed protein product [Calypogeia fissa]